MLTFRLIRRLGYTAAVIGVALCAVNLAATEARDTIGGLDSSDGPALLSILPSTDTSPTTPADSPTVAGSTIGSGAGDTSTRDYTPGTGDPLDAVRDAVGENIADPFWTLGDALSGD